jgi:hypothetical protein
MTSLGLESGQSGIGPVREGKRRFWKCWKLLAVKKDYPRKKKSKQCKIPKITFSSLGFAPERPVFQLAAGHSQAILPAI